MNWLRELNLYGAGFCTGLTIVYFKTNLTWSIIFGVIALMNYLAYFKQQDTTTRRNPI